MLAASATLSTLGLVVLSMAGMWLTRKRQIRTVDVIPWAIALLVGGTFGAATVASGADQPFFLLYMTITALVVAIGLVRSLQSRRYQQKVSTQWFFGVTRILLLGVIILRLLPPVHDAREAVRRTQCRNNLKQIGLAMHDWHDEFDRYPDAAASDDDGTPISWRVGLLNHLDSSYLTIQYDTRQAWDSDANLPAAPTTAQCLCLPFQHLPGRRRGAPLHSIRSDDRSRFSLSRMARVVSF
jgi:hypothetical protein